MTVTNQALRYGQRRAMRKLGRMIPWIGAAFAMATLAATMQRKGVVRGAVDAAIDVIPVIGGLKMLAETVRGRDFIADRVQAAR
jgi:hypothetical protein